MNSQAITNGHALAYNIFSNGNDPIENEISRTPMRVGGLVGGIFVGAPFGGLFALDTICDFKKLQLLKEKTELLQPSVIDPKSADFEKANASIEFQKNVYENIETYTKTAMTIKTLAALFFLSVPISMFAFGTKIIHDDRGFPHIINENPLADPIQNTLSLFGLGSAIAALGHKWTAKPALESKNQELANQFILVK